VEVRKDPDCVWSDGQIEGYCTEFYLDDIEIGNIVNPLGDCLDCGFGGERLQHLLDRRGGRPQTTPTRSQILTRTIEVLLDSGVLPSHRHQGYVLRTLLREQIRLGQPLPSHDVVNQERERRRQLLLKLPHLRRRHPGQSLQYFWETHGIHPTDWEDQPPS
jgi:hypothetical protein